MHRKSDKNRTEPNELDELKYSKSLTQMTNYAHRYVLVFACSDEICHQPKPYRDGVAYRVELWSEKHH